MQTGVSPEQIISIELDNDINLRYRNPLELGTYLRSMVSNIGKDYYVLLDEIQMVESIDNPYLPKETGSKIQSALTVADEEKHKQEVNSLNRIGDSYTKIVVVHDNILPSIDDKGVKYINIEDFLLEKINEL